MEYKSQHKQDEFIINHFKGKRNGVFIDIGAHDGITLSNTYILEKEYGWKGICIEPMIHQYKKLKENRNCITYNCAIYDNEDDQPFLILNYDGYPDMLSGIVKDMNLKQMSELMSESERMGADRKIIKVPCRLLNKILEENNINYIDVLSIDTEGAETKIIKSIDFNKITIDLIIYENGGKANELRKFLIDKGFKMIKNLGPDDVFKNNNI